MRNFYTILILFLLPAGVSAAENQDVLPVVWRISEGVSPGKLVSLFGGNLTGLPVIKFVDSKGKILAKQRCLQNDSAGQFARVIFPDIPPGVYAIYVSNNTGWSALPVYINRADPRWVSEERGYPGLKMKLMGRNLDASGYGGNSGTEIRLISSDKGITFNTKPLSISSYALDFIIPEEIEPGNYYIEVKTGSASFGQEWVRLTNASEHPDKVSDIKIAIEKAPADKLAIELGVPWANDFNWTVLYNVKTGFNAMGDGKTDDTKAIQNAIDNAAHLGGGIVFLPAGTYNISGLLLDKNIILKGENKAKTTLHYYRNEPATGTVNIIFESRGSEDDPASAKRVGLQGICNIKVTVSPLQDKSKKLLFCELGCGREKPWPPDNKYLTASRIFIYNCIIDFGFDSRFWDGFEVSGAGHVLVAGNSFFVGSPCWSHAVKEYFTIRDNSIDFSSEQVSVSADKLIMENNMITGHLIPGVTTNLHGVFTNEAVYGFNMWNSYFNNNVVKNLNYVPGNDGEIFCLDSHPWLIKGRVAGSTANSVTFNGDFTKPDNALQTGSWNQDWMAVIYEGKGLGQLRRVTSHKADPLDPGKWVISLDKSWDMPPDSTSKLAIGRFHTGVVIENNKASDCCNAILFYNGCIDNVVAYNELKNTLGIAVNGWQLADGYPGMSFFNVIRHNSSTGKSSRFDNAWIGERGEDFRVPLSGISLYGNDFRDNSIDRSDCYDHKNDDSRSPGGFVISQVNGFSKGKAILGSLYEDNTTLNSFYGISINDGSVYGAVIRNMKYTNVKKKVNDYGSKTIVITE